MHGRGCGEHSTQMVAMRSTADITLLFVTRDGCCQAVRCMNLFSLKIAAIGLYRRRGTFLCRKKSTHENSMDRPLVSSGETLGRERKALNLTDPTIWHKVAAFSGLAAIGLGAYGTHGFRPHNAAYKEVWQTASLFHLVHTAALVGAPITKHPNIFGALLTAGILAFSGACYTAAYLEDRKYSFLAPFGGFAFMAAWASLLF